MILNKFSKNITILIFFSLLHPLFSQGKITEKIDSVNSITYDFIVSNLKKSIDIFENNLEKAKQINYQRGIAFSNNNLGLAYYLSGQYDKSTSAYLNAINLFEKLNLVKHHAETLGEFGYQLKRRDLDKANYYMKEGIKIAETNNYDTTLAKLYDNYGVLKEMDGQLDSAMYFYNKSLSTKLQLNDSLGIPYSLNKIAGIAAMQGNYQKALDVMKQSDEYRYKEKGEFGKIENLVLYGDIYSSKGDINKAIDYYETGLKQSIEENINYLIRYCYQHLTELYKQTGRYEDALNALQSFTSYKDSVLNEEVQVKVAELELAFETEKKDRQIAESKLEISEKTSQLYLVIGISVFLTFFLFAVFVYQKREREKLLLEGKLKQAELENKISEEKLRISRELHDNIGSQLTFMISSIDNYVYKTNEQPEVLNQISEFGRDTLKELRNTIWALKHEGTDVSELILKMNELVQKINTTIDQIEIKFESSVNQNISLTSVQMLNLFRILQEGIQNAVKHSGADSIRIKLANVDNELLLSIKDNGKGFDSAKIVKGNGLESMEKRSKECGGNFSIESSEDGTKIICSVSFN